MNKALALAACSAIMAGCAGVDCSSDWYSTGQSDGRIGADSQAERYAAHCSGQIDRQRYEEGRQSGLAMRPRISAF
jgi:hypothetical protein